MKAKRQLIFLSGYLILVLFMQSCKDEITIPELTTTFESFYFAGTFTAVVRGTISSNGGSPIMERGVCWSLTHDPTLKDNSAKDTGVEEETYICQAYGLRTSTTYYFRAYATNIAGTGYGNEVSFTFGSGGDEVWTILPPDTPKNPVPASNSTSISVTPTLKWDYSFGYQGSHSNQSPPIIYSLLLDTLANPLVEVTSDTIPQNYNNMQGNTSVTITLNKKLLVPYKKYYWKVVVRDSRGVSTSSDTWNFTTVQNVTLPQVTTSQVTKFSGVTATVGGNLTSDGGSSVTARGIYMGISPDPEKTGSKLQIGSGIGSFSLDLKGLVPNTSYYIKAYATNSQGTTYGSQVSFTTNPGYDHPILTTHFISNWRDGTATGGGSVTDDGGAAITARGVCWNTSGNVTINDNKTIDGTGTGHFTSKLTALASVTTLHFRAYATNSAGTGYGDEYVYTYKEGITTDLDGNEYHYKTIGNQTWMTDNLKTKRFRNGDTIKTTIPNNKNIAGEISPEYQWKWTGDGASASTYGRYYTGFTVADTRNVCPSGWHVPSDEEWTALSAFLGGDAVSGGKLKSTSVWSAPNTGGTNESGFSALPAGIREANGTHLTPGRWSYFWSSTVSSEGIMWYRMLDYQLSSLSRISGGMSAGMDVRCIRD
jgi:uncharacterized protein (TIGR02145 family)